MGQFRYYITDTMDGVIKGTNDELMVAHLRTSEDYFIVDTKKNVFLQAGGDDDPIVEADYPPPETGGEGGDDDIPF